MSAGVLCVILLAAMLHAGWNATVRGGADKQLGTAVVAGGSGLIAAVLLPFMQAPAPASWPYLAASVVVQMLYYVLLIFAYRSGELGQVYPVMRGLAPLFVSVAGAVLLHESMRLVAWGGIGVICLGVVAMAWDGLRRSSGRAALPLAAGNAALIACYTILDGLGVRRSGDTLSHTLGYVGWVFVLTAIPLLGWTVWRRAGALGQLVVSRPLVGLFGGCGTLISYGLVLWAMTRAPVAMVAALRETSILFATGISVFLLHEKLSQTRLLAVVLIAGGAALVRLG